MSAQATSIQFGAAACAGEGTVQPLHLNDHCPVCEFQVECRSQAIKEDSLTLLRGVGENELGRYVGRGLFTLTQLSHTFKQHRLGKRARPVSSRPWRVPRRAHR